METAYSCQAKSQWVKCFYSLWYDPDQGSNPRLAILRADTPPHTSSDHCVQLSALCRAAKPLKVHGVIWKPSDVSSSCLLPRVSVTGESPPSLSKELTNSLAGVGDVSFDADTQFPLDELKIDPLTLDGLHMLNDPDMVLADPATEDTFRMDRL